MPCNASSLLTANPFTQLDRGLQEAVKLQLLCNISGGSGGIAIGGSGTAGALAKFTAGTTLGDSLFTESGSAMTLAGNQVITQGTITADTPALSITSTWNNAAVGFSGLKVSVTNTASASASYPLDVQVGGTSTLRSRRDGQLDVFGAGSSLRLLSNDSFLSLGSGVDVYLYRDAANALANRNSTNAQSFRVYNTYTSSTNFERGVFDWQTTANTLRIGTEKGSGGGTARDLVLVTDGTVRVTFGGASSTATFAGIVASNVGYRGGSATYIGWLSRSFLKSSADGLIDLTNSAGTDFDRLQFGGTTSSFPALKRNGAILDVKLADDSAYASIGTQFISVTDGITAPGAVVGRTRIYVDTADGDLKVVFGDGTVKTLATDT